jgi:hypothetical protein
MAFTAGFSVNVGDPTKASDVDVLAANDDYLKNAIDTFIANDANNRVLTGTGSGTANAETNLTFDGSTLTVTGTVSATTFSGNVTGGTISGSTGTFSGVTTVGSAGATADFAVWTDGTSSTAAGFTVDASADEVIVGQLSGGGNTNFKVRNRLNNTVFQVTPDAPSTTVFAPNIATGSAGNLTVKTGSINSDSIRLEAGGTTSTWLESRGYLGHSWYVDSTRSMTLDSTGLGVGTDSPTRLLSLYSSSPTSVFQSFTNSSTGNTASDGAQIGIDSNNDLQIGQLESGKLIEFYNNGSLAMVIDDSQRVGISTASPATLLHASGASSASALRLDETTSSANSYLGYIDTSGNFGIDVNGGGYLRFAVGGAERARITSAGNFGINTASPEESLTVHGGSSTTSTVNITGGAAGNDNATLASDYGMFYQIDANNTIGGRIFNWRVGGKGYSDGTSLLTLNASGNMGLGVTPSAWLSTIRALQVGDGASVYNAGGAGGDVYYNNNWYVNSSSQNIYLNNGYALSYGQAGGEHRWFTAPSGTAGNTVSFTQAMVLTNAGLLGLGTVSPQVDFHVNNASTNGVARISTSNAGSYAQLQLVNQSGNYWYQTIVSDNSYRLYNGSDRLTLTSAGLIGLGTSSPAAPLHLIAGTPSASADAFHISDGTYTNIVMRSGAADGEIRIGAAGTQRGRYAAQYAGTRTSHNFSLGTNDITAITIDTSQRVGIGSSSPSYPLVVSNGGAAGYEFNVNGLNGGVNTVVYNRSTSAYVDSAHFVNNYYIYSGQTPAERFRVESTGVCAFMTSNVNIRFNGTATSTVLTDNDGVEIHTGGFIWAARQAGSLYLSRAGSTGEIAAFRYDAVTQVGSISVTSTATAYNTSSDYRLKENLVPITGAVDRVNALQPRRFNFLSDPNTTVDGFVAHEVSPVVPEAISGEKDAVDEDGNPEYQGIDQSKLVPLLTAAIQELTARIEALEAA